MENKAHALVAGAFTIALLTAAILIGVWLNRDRVEWVPYQIATKLSVPGLNPQADVRYRGLDVGKVQEISFDRLVAGQILVHLNIRPDTPITQSTYATLGYQGVTGIAYVQLDDDGSKPTRVPSSREKIARIEMRPSLFDQLQNRGLAILEQTEQAVTRINALLAPENQQKILAAFDSLGNVAAEFEAIPRQLHPTLAKLPAMTAQAQQTLTSLNALATDAKKLTGNLNGMASALQAPNGAISAFTGAAAQVRSTADRLESETLPAVNDVRASLRVFNRTLDRLNERPQSVLFGGSGLAPGPGEPGFVEP